MRSKGYRSQNWGLYFYNKDRFHLLIHKYYCKYFSIYTQLSHYILSVSFGPVLSAIVQLLPQIIVRKNMRTALFCVVCALLYNVFIMSHNVFIMLFNWIGPGQGSRFYILGKINDIIYTDNAEYSKRGPCVALQSLIVGSIFF